MAQTINRHMAARLALHHEEFVSESVSFRFSWRSRSVPGVFKIMCFLPFRFFLSLFDNDLIWRSIGGWL
jgi:hypothetical protein